MSKNCWESSPKIIRKNKFVVLNCEATSSNKSIHITLNEEGIIWNENNSDKANIIKHQQIINVKRSKNNPLLCINYLIQSSSLIMKYKKFKFLLSSLSESEKWSKAIIRKIRNSFNRIKTLFIFIDRIANRYKVDGKIVFDGQIKALLEDVCISYKVKELESQNDIMQIEEYAETLTKYDGVIIMGGDETISAIISTFINSFQDGDTSLKPIPIPFGILPIGYHNDISKSIWESDNVENAFLNILLCHTFQGDVLCISNKNSPDRIWGFNFQYGYSSNYEKYRFENNLLNFTAKESSIVRKAVENFGQTVCDVRYVSNDTMGSPQDNKKCNMKCSDCNILKPLIVNVPVQNLNSSMKSELSDKQESEANSSTVYETYKWIIVNSIPCSSELTINGFTPSCHFNDGTADLVMLKSASKKDFKKFLKLLQYDGTHLSLPFVKCVRIEEVNVTLSSQSSWNIIQKEMPKTSNENDSHDMIVIEDELTSISDIDEENSKETTFDSTQNNGQIKNLDKKKKSILKPIVKAYKEMTKTTTSQTEDEFYKRPNMLESDRERERKEAKEKKRKEKLEKEKPVWMLDYNFLENFNPTIKIKVHSSIISFYGRSPASW